MLKHVRAVMNKMKCSKSYNLIMIFPITLGFSNGLPINKDCNSTSFCNYFEHFTSAKDDAANSLDIDQTQSSISVLIEFNDQNDKFDKKSASKDDCNIDSLSAKREKMSLYYASTNLKSALEVGLKEKDLIISHFSPHIEIKYKTYEDYIDDKAKLEKIAENSKSVKSINASYSCYDESDVNPASFSTNYPLSKAFSDIGISSSNYNGEGIKIGTIETGTPINTNNLNPSLFTSLSSTQTQHSSIVTSIIGGNTGIAKGAQIYCIGLSDYDFVNCVNILIENYNVNIINMSYGFNSNGVYDNYCAYIDFVAQNASCLFVKSAGNNGSTSSYISSPGASLNALTVASNDANCSISYYSSNVLKNYKFKPDVTAPGGSIYGIPNLSGQHSGTSFSAPMVTGIAALLMQQFPFLKYNISLLITAIRSSCVYLNGQTDFYDSFAGYGLVNYSKAQYFISKYQYWNFNIPSKVSDSSTIYSCSFDLKSNNQLKILAGWAIPSNYISPNNSSFEPVFSRCSLKLYDIELDKYVISNKIDSNSGYLLYINPTNHAKSYRLDIVISGSKNKAGIELGSGIYSVEKVDHSHSYDYSYAPSTTDKHKAYCGCGLYILKTHVVLEKDIYTLNGSRYGNCRDCGILVNLSKTSVTNPEIN